ncbi:GntR family transcriptional regulator [Sulfitobacter sp. HNIBRBA3233]|uniref:GntR family transcriptional regulator n=1 Tax=Sulfitobacter marinivivus TaxID=3158558 RepID=UPI0032DEDEA7
MALCVAHGPEDRETPMQMVKQPKSLTEQTHDILLEAICTGELLPGERLNQDEIAARLQVSRQPVNSAISVLKANGFVEDTGRRGVVVSHITGAQFTSIYEFRTGMEPFAIRLAMERRPATAASQAQDVLKQGWEAVETGDATRKLRADAAFHEMIYGWTGNQIILSTMQMHWQHIRRSIGVVIQKGVAARTSWEEHERIVDAMMRDDVESAVSEMEDHIARAHRITSQRLREASV